MVGPTRLRSHQPRTARRCTPRTRVWRWPAFRPLRPLPQCSGARHGRPRRKQWRKPLATPARNWFHAQGTMTFDIAGTRHEVGPGDALHFMGDQPITGSTRARRGSRPVGRTARFMTGAGRMTYYPIRICSIVAHMASQLVNDAHRHIGLLPAFPFYGGPPVHPDISARGTVKELPRRPRCRGHRASHGHAQLRSSRRLRVVLLQRARTGGGRGR